MDTHTDGEQAASRCAGRSASFMAGLGAGSAEYKGRQDAQAQNVALEGVVALLREKLGKA